MALAGLSKLELLVVSEAFETETTSFWLHPDFNSKDIQTEVILLPAAVAFEKDGTMTNSSRWIQGKKAVVAPKGESMPDGDMIYEIMKRLKKILCKQ